MSRNQRDARNHRRATFYLRPAAVILVMLGGLCFAIPDGMAQQSADTRERLSLPAPLRDTVLKEMRGMLESLSGILAALSVDDMRAAATAARASGMAAAADMDPSIRTLLPSAFLELGMETHRQFDALAASLERSPNTRGTLAELADLGRKCVACHGTYRLDETR